MVGGIYWIVCGCFVYMCVYIYVCTGKDVKGTLTIDCWLSGFESLSYNRNDDANQTARGHLQSFSFRFHTRTPDCWKLKGHPRERVTLYMPCFSLFFS